MQLATAASIHKNLQEIPPASLNLKIHFFVNSFFRTYTPTFDKEPLSSAEPSFVGKVDYRNIKNSPVNQTPLYAEKPPSIGRTTPVMKLAEDGEIKRSVAGASSLKSPNLPIGVAFRIL